MESVSPETSARVLRAALSAESLWITTEGSSMGATIADGDEVKLVEAARPRRGEVWAYIDSQGQLVAHRCVGFRGGQVVFRGDAQPMTDRLVPPSNVVGRVTHRSRGASIERVGRVGGLAKIIRWKLDALRRRFAPL